MNEPELNKEHVDNALEMHPDWTIKRYDSTWYSSTSGAVYTYKELIENNTINYPFLFTIIKGMDDKGAERYFDQLAMILMSADDSLSPLMCPPVKRRVATHTASIPDILEALHNAFAGN